MKYVIPRRSAVEAQRQWIGQLGPGDRAGRGGGAKPAYVVRKSASSFAKASVDRSTD